VLGYEMTWTVTQWVITGHCEHGNDRTLWTR